jgi:hypothetical protein
LGECGGESSDVAEKEWWEEELMMCTATDWRFAYTQAGCELTEVANCKPAGTSVSFQSFQNWLKYIVLCLCQIGICFSFLLMEISLKCRSKLVPSVNGHWSPIGGVCFWELRYWKSVVSVVCQM